MGLSGLCSNPLEAQLPFRLWPMSSPLSVLAQANLELYLLRETQEALAE